MTRRGREIQLEGLEELQHMAEKVSPREARNLARSTVHWIAGQARDRMRQRAPVDEATLRKAIHSKRKRARPGEAISDVRISHGSDAKHDAWHWHFVEFGTTKHSAQPYIVPTIEEIGPQVPNMYRDEFGKRLEKRLNAKAKIPR